MKLSSSRAVLVLWFGLMVAAMPGNALAAPIIYGDFSGASVWYLDVTEDTTTGDPLPLFDTPSITIDTLNFTPTADFAATAAGSGISDSTQGVLTFTIRPKDGVVLTSLFFDETGDTELSGSGTDATNTSVVASIKVTVTEVDDVAITPIMQTYGMLFTPSSGDYGLGTDGGGGPSFETDWMGQRSVDLPDLLDRNRVPFTKGATEIEVEIINTLNAASEAGTSATIAKKVLGLEVDTTPTIPEPASIAFATLALGALAARRRTR